MGLVWVDCDNPVLNAGLAQILGAEARVHVGREPPKGDPPSVVMLCIDDAQAFSEDVKRVREANQEALVVAFSFYPDLERARAALERGARGFIHSEMTPNQIVRALKVGLKGEMVAPRQLLEYLVSTDGPVDLNVLSKRQREILELVGEGLGNAQIAKRLYLTESTVKQHLRAAYKILGVSNRTEASRLLRNSD